MPGWGFLFRDGSCLLFSSFCMGKDPKKKKREYRVLAEIPFFFFLKDRIPVNAYNSPKPPFPPKPSRAVVATMRWG